MSVAEAVAPLFVPADRPDRFAKAAGSGADAVILDLEDAVAPARKEEARQALACDAAVPVLVRINDVNTPWWREDLEAAILARPAGIIVPKADGGSAFLTVCDAAAAAGLIVIALVESAVGVGRARAIAAHATVARLAFGSIDYCADLNCEHSREALLAARSELVLASRMAGAPAPLDGVTTALDDPDVVVEDARHARSLGFSGKLAIHPRQIAPVLAGFRPDEAEVQWARAVLSGGDGATSIEGTMVDAPVRARARAILQRLDLSSTALPADR